MRLAVVVLTAVLGGSSIGYDTGSVSGALLFLRRSFHLSSLMQGVVTGIALAGAALGAAVAGLLADRFGRRPVLVATASIFLIGAVLSGAAEQLSLLLAARVLVGIGIGGAAMLIPLYLAEIAPPARRGALVAFNQLAVTVGVLCSYLVGYGFASGFGWRWMLGLGALPALLLATGMLVLPETPFWLVAHHRIDRARAALQRVRGRRGPISRPNSTGCEPSSASARRHRPPPPPRARRTARAAGSRWRRLWWRGWALP